MKNQRCLYYFIYLIQILKGKSTWYPQLKEKYFYYIDKFMITFIKNDHNLYSKNNYNLSNGKNHDR